MSLPSLPLDLAAGSGINSSVAHPHSKAMVPRSVVSTQTKQAPTESVRWYVNIQQARSVVGSPRRCITDI